LAAGGRVRTLESSRGIDPTEVVAALLELDPEVRLQAYYGEQSLFYNPGGVAPLGVIFASLKENDGPNDRASRLSRAGVYRLAFQLTTEEFRAHFGAVPPRPARGGVVAVDADPAALNELTPHPVYAWMRWAQILAPTRQQFAAVRPLLEESLSLARAKWQRRGA
jgi:Family of unknown function (DUF6194)